MVCIDAWGQPSRRKRGRGVGIGQVEGEPARDLGGWQELCCLSSSESQPGHRAERDAAAVPIGGGRSTAAGAGGAQREHFCTACPLRCVSLVPCSLSVLVSLRAKLSLNAWSGENCNLFGEKE